MKTLLNHDNKAATINLSEISTFKYDGTKNDSVKTWEQLNDSEKQDIASNWIADHVYCNVNQVMELLAQNDDHCDFDEYQSIAEYPDYEEVSINHIRDLTIDELLEVADDIDVHSCAIQLFVDKYLTDLIENTNNTNFSVQDAYHELDVTFLQDMKVNYEYAQDEIEKELVTYFKNNVDSMSFDDLDTCVTNLGINFDGYLKAYQIELSDLVINNIDLDEYGQENNLDPEYQQAYEFWSVSDHFIAMLEDSSQCSNDILGLSVWARYCTGQAICLDHQVQLAAFKALSDCSYTNY